MRREEKRRKIHEAILNTLYPPPPSPPSQEDQDEEPANTLDDDFDVGLLSPDVNEGSSASISDDDDGNECGPEKLTRAQRKRFRKKKLNEEARRRRNIIGPLLPATTDGGGGEIDSPGVRQNADEKCAVPSDFSGGSSGCRIQKKLKHRRKAKRLAREQLKLDRSVSKNNSGDQIPESAHDKEACGENKTG